MHLGSLQRTQFILFEICTIDTFQSASLSDEKAGILRFRSSTGSALSVNPPHGREVLWGFIRALRQTARLGVTANQFPTRTVGSFPQNAHVGFWCEFIEASPNVR